MKQWGYYLLNPSLNNLIDYSVATAFSSFRVAEPMEKWTFTNRLVWQMSQQIIGALVCACQFYFVGVPVRGACIADWVVCEVSREIGFSMSKQLPDWRNTSLIPTSVDAHFRFDCAPIIRNRLGFIHSQQVMVRQRSDKGFLCYSLLNERPINYLSCHARPSVYVRILFDITSTLFGKVLF